MSILNQNHPDEFSRCSFSFPFGTSNDREALTGNKKQREEQIDSLLAHAMTSLTFDERQKQQEILHGVETEIPENDSLLNDSFEALNYHLDTVKSGTAYEIAESQNVLYVSDNGFRLMFLRGNRFDAKAAAEQMIRFFQMKRNLFGVEKLAKDITMNDLDEDDRA